MAHESQNQNIDRPKRDFIFIAAGTVAAMGVGLSAWPMVAQMNPAADRLVPRFFTVDLELILEGQQMRMQVDGRPIFIRHRTPEEIFQAQNTDITGLLHPETDTERLKPLPDGSYNPKYLILFGFCTHFGCVTIGEEGDYDGWYCPCHGSHFDTSGRIRKGPAPRNMEIPEYEYVTPTTIRFFYHFDARVAPTA